MIFSHPNTPVSMAALLKCYHFLPRAISMTYPVVTQLAEISRGSYKENKGTLTCHFCTPTFLFKPLLSFFNRAADPYSIGHFKTSNAPNKTRGYIRFSFLKSPTVFFCNSNFKTMHMKQSRSNTNRKRNYLCKFQ